MTARDHGPMARLADVVADEGAPSEVFRLLTDADGPRTLSQIAKAWAVPKGRFIEWFTTTHSALYDAALKVRADEIAHETLSIADEQAEVVKKDGSTFDPDVGRDKLRVETRLKLAAQWDRPRYGSKEDRSGGGITVIVDRSCGGTVEIEAGGAVARIPLSGGTEASAIPAAGLLEKLEI